MSKRLKSIVIFATVLLVVFLSASSPAPTDEPSVDPRFFNKSWEQIMGETVKSWGYKGEYVAIGYKNTVTGEEHYFNPDNYIYAASIYKLPLNMYFSELISEGEMTMDSKIGGYQYSTIQKASMVASNNSLSEMLRRCFNSFEEYKLEICKYTCANTEEFEALPENYFKKLEFTPRQMINCLTVLEKTPERFPNMIDYMLTAQQDEYFAQYEDRYPIAHKYGFFRTEHYTAVNDVGIVFMEDPILLAMLTKTGNPSILGKYCVLMCDYTEFRTEMRKKQEAALAAAAVEKQEEPEPTPEPSPPHQTSPEAAETPSEQSPTPNEAQNKIWLTIAALGAALVVLAGLQAIKLAKKNGRG